MRYRVVFSPEADSQLIDLYAYIAAAGSADVAETYIAALIAHCESLSTFPNRGTLRDDIEPGLRSMGFRRRLTIAFQVVDDRVDILRILYAGQDFETAFRSDNE